jgi:hypothetical protein
VVVVVEEEEDWIGPVGFGNEGLGFDGGSPFNFERERERESTSHRGFTREGESADA